MMINYMNIEKIKAMIQYALQLEDVVISDLQRRAQKN